MSGKTEFEDLLIERGIIPEPAPAPQKKVTYINVADDEILSLSEGEDDEQAFEEYRKSRIREMTEAKILTIKSSDFIEQVTKSSENQDVVVLLYKDQHDPSSAMMQNLHQLAQNYRKIKFTKIISTECISDFPDSNLPTIILYSNSAVEKQWIKCKFNDFASYLKTKNTPA